MKISESQLYMLIEIVTATAEEFEDIAGYSDYDIFELLSDIKGQMSDSLIELSEVPVSLTT